MSTSRQSSHVAVFEVTFSEKKVNLFENFGISRTSQFDHAHVLDGIPGMRSQQRTVSYEQ